jgi:hypothetical protein
VLRRVCAAAVVLPALLVAGCSSSGGSGTPTSPRATPSVSHSLTPGSAALAAKIRRGLDGLTSAHVVVNAGALGGTSVGDIRYADGKATASEIVVDSGTDTTRIITVGATSYAKLPASRNTTGKPWVKVSTASPNEFVRALASSLTLTAAASSLPALADLAGTATSVTKRGAHRYALVIDPARSTGSTLGTLLGQIGQKAVPVKLVLDGKGRPTAVDMTVKLGSQTFVFTVRASRFNAPVKITPPPTGQVGAG